MDTICILPNNLKGSISIPASKSVAHRAIIAASLADGISNITNITYSDDINATINAMIKLGVKIEKFDDTIKIEGGIKQCNDNINIDCCESASTLRFLIPISLLYTNSITFTGKSGLAKRPLNPYFEIFDKQGISYTKQGFPLNISGELKSGLFELDGTISSQFVTGLMYTLPLLSDNSNIKILENLESRGYINLTMDILKTFSVSIQEVNKNCFDINGNQAYMPANFTIEGDYSQAAFWIVAGLLGGNIACKGLRKDSMQSDMQILDIAKKMGGALEFNENVLYVQKSETHGTTIDISNCPDLAPILSVLGSLSIGTTKIINAKRLRIKECDRLTAIVTELKKLGANIEEYGDAIIIEGKKRLVGGHVNSWNDHRIAMAMSIASIGCDSPVIIDGYKSVSKSYPHFYNDFRILGGIIDERNMG